MLNWYALLFRVGGEGLFANLLLRDGWRRGLLLEGPPLLLRQFRPSRPLDEAANLGPCSFVSIWCNDDVDEEDDVDFKVT